MRKTDEIKADIEALEKTPSYYGNEWKTPKRENLYGEYVIAHGVSFGRLEGICVAESDGRLLIPHCKLGDTVYTVWTNSPHSEKSRQKDIVPAKVIKIEYTQYGFAYRTDYQDCYFHQDAIGKSVFLAPEDAEAAAGDN